MFDWDDPLDASEGEKKVDLSKLSVKELKQRIKDARLTIPPGVAEKSELVELLRDAESSNAAAPPAAKPPVVEDKFVAAPVGANFVAPPVGSNYRVPPADAKFNPPERGTSAAQGGGSEATATAWRCVMQPRMVVRERMSTEAPVVRAVQYGEEVNVEGAAGNGWLKVVGGGYVLIKHDKLGTLLEPLGPDVTISIAFAPGVMSSFIVKRGSTVAALKKKLAAEDPTGATKPEEFHLAIPAAISGGKSVALADGTELGEKHKELELAVRSATAAAAAAADAGGSERASVDWESVRDESAKKVLAARGKPYLVLDLAAGTGSADIRRAYHRLSLLHHPDKGGDAEVFREIGKAYRALTQARDESGGWRDIEGQAVGPWLGHTEMLKGVNVVRFDHFTCPPWESRRLYTGAFQEGSLRCWELSRGEPGKVAPPPRLLGEIHCGGFLNDIALLSPFGLLTAQSAGLKPQPGESLRTWNLNVTPFRKVKENWKAIEGGGGRGKPALPTGSQPPPEDDDEPEEQLATIEEEYEPHPEAVEDLLKSQMMYLHYRGVRACSLFPSPENRETVPQLVGTISKDYLAQWRITRDGLGLEPTPTWKIGDPHLGTDPASLKFEAANKMWTAGNNGVVKCWDVNAAMGKEEIFSLATKSHGMISGMEFWADPGVMVFSHSSGMGFIDIRAGKVIRTQYTKGKVGGLSIANDRSPALFAAIGKDLIQYDTRFWRDGIDYKPKSVSSWTLRGVISAVHSMETARGHILVACGCENGCVAAFDTA